MSVWRMMALPALVAMGTWALAQTASEPAANRPKTRLTVEDVVHLANAGISEEVILAEIRSKHQSFDLSTDQLLQLNAAGISNRVIRAMIERPSQAAQTQPANHRPSTITASPSPARPRAAVAAVSPRTPPVSATAALSAPVKAPVRRAGIPPPPAAIATPPARAGVPVQPSPAPANWVTHDDPAGFAVSLPAGWNLAAGHPQGRIVTAGPQGQQAIVWPMFIEKRQLDAHGAAILVRQLAHRADPAAAWGDPQPGASTVVRVLARGERSGVAVMRWNSAPEGAAVYLFCVTAPSSLYRASMDDFAGILKSFHVLPAPTTGSQGARATGAASAGPLQWVRWSDPREGAFTASVPQGWSVSGGSFRQSATDIRKSVVLLSPDRQIRITSGDANLGSFSVPNAMYARAGLRPGATTTLGDGTRLEIRNYEPARQFLPGYVARTVGRDCTAPRVLSIDERPDLAASLNQQARTHNVRHSQVSAAGVAFSCTWNGRDARGYYAAATVLLAGVPASPWYVDSLYGYLAVADRQQEADSIARRVSGSMQVDSQWQQRESGIAATAVEQDNARSQEIQTRARAAIAADQQQTSDMIVKGYQARSKVYDEISRRRENSILGTVDVVDPSTGTQYKIDNYSDYHWMNNQGTIAGTRTYASPGYDWRQMIDLP
jgi:hypothetical protein